MSTQRASGISIDWSRKRTLVRNVNGAPINPEVRVNALKYDINPAYRATLRFTRQSLEEKERNMLSQINLLRERQPA